MKEIIEEDHIDRFAEVAKGLKLEKLIANKLANFIHYEVMTAKRNKEKSHQNQLKQLRDMLPCESAVPPEIPCLGYVDTWDDCRNWSLNNGFDQKIEPLKNKLYQLINKPCTKT